MSVVSVTSICSATTDTAKRETYDVGVIGTYIATQRAMDMRTRDSLWGCLGPPTVDPDFLLRSWVSFAIVDALDDLGQLPNP